MFSKFLINLLNLLIAFVLFGVTIYFMVTTLLAIFEQVPMEYVLLKFDQSILCASVLFIFTDYALNKLEE